MPGDWPDNRYKPTVSHSSIGKFQACDLAYALHYHHSIIPDINQRFEHKREAILQPLNYFPGSVFHETILWALMDYRSTRVFPSDLMPLARNITREYINFSREWVADVQKHPLLGGLHPYWPDHPFAQPIESFYYDGDFPPNYRKTVKEKLERWFERFLTLMPSLPFSSVDPATWLFPKEVSAKAPWFVHDDDFAVYAVFDFLTRDGDSIAIYDWKTGKRSTGESSVAEQLMTYAAYAINKWSVPPDSIKLYAVWVDDGSVQEVECDPWELNRMAGIWESHQHDWKARLDQVNGDAEKLFELFPMTNNLRTCSRCAFRTCLGRTRTAANTDQNVTEIEFLDY